MASALAGPLRPQAQLTFSLDIDRSFLYFSGVTEPVMARGNMKGGHHAIRMFYSNHYTV